MVIIRIQPALMLKDKKDPELVQYTTDRANDLTLHSDSFPGLKPTPAELTAQNVLFIAALAAMSERSTSKTIKKNKLRRKLEVMLMNCAENCAEIADGDLELYSLSNFGYKRNPSPTPDTIPAPANFTLQIGPGEGQLYANFKTEASAHSYEIWYGKADVNPNDWTDFISTTSGKKNLLNELQSGVIYGARVRAIGAKKSKGEWSSVQTKKTY